MILHLLRKRRNVNWNVFNDRKNVSATSFQNQKPLCQWPLCACTRAFHSGSDASLRCLSLFINMQKSDYVPREGINQITIRNWRTHLIKRGAS